MILQLEPMAIEPRSYTNKSGVKVEQSALICRDIKGNGHYCGQTFELNVADAQLVLAERLVNASSVMISVSVLRMFSERSVRLQGELLS